MKAFLLLWLLTLPATAQTLVIHPIPSSTIPARGKPVTGVAPAMPLSTSNRVTAEQTISALLHQGVPHLEEDSTLYRQRTALESQLRAQGATPSLLAAANAWRAQALASTTSNP